MLIFVSVRLTISNVGLRCVLQAAQTWSELLQYGRPDLNARDHASNYCLSVRLACVLLTILKCLRCPWEVQLHKQFSSTSPLRLRLSGTLLLRSNSSLYLCVCSSCTSVPFGFAVPLLSINKCFVRLFLCFKCCRSCIYMYIYIYPVVLQPNSGSGCLTVDVATHTHTHTHTHV
jgi:hypothetical protein